MDPMPVVPEGQTPPMYVAEGTPDGRGGGGDQQRHIVVPRRFMIRRRRADRPPPTTATDEDCYDSRVVDFLDVVDPEVATLSSITNIQNSLFVPSLGRLVNRRPTYDLSQLPFVPGAFPPSKEDVSTPKEERPASSSEGTADEAPIPVRRTHSISTVLTANTPQYAILPDDPDHTLEGWSEEDIKLLNDHVRHLLHSRRSKIKQRFKGFLKYASRPLGFLVTLYATLITLFGLAWVLFLIGWIYVGEKQLYVIDVIDNVLVALFAVMGDGLIPWRLYDTYNMLWIAHYHRKTLKLRKKLLLPKLEDKNDLPIDQNDPSARMVDLEAARALPKRGAADDYYPVLTDEEQAKLVHYQTKLAKSHTFYKPHETSTHRAFPHHLAMTIILLLDLHSCLQVSLGTVTWSIPYERRPAAATTTILCCSITVNALAGILISVGDRRTRKKDVVERLVRQELTGEVMDKMVKERRKEKEKQEKERLERENEGGEKEKEKGLLGMSLGDFTRGSSSMESSKEGSKTRSSSEEGRRTEGKGGRRSLDALTEGIREGFKRKSLEGRRQGDTSETSVRRKEKDKVGRFDPATVSASGSRRSYSGGSGVQGSGNGNDNGNGLGSVAEADYEPHYQHVQGYQKQEQQGLAEQQGSVEKRKMPGSFEE